MVNSSDPPWEDRILLFLYFNKFSYFTEIERQVTKHPYRTKRLLDRLEDAGLIKSEYEQMELPNGKRMQTMRIVTLTDKGKKYVEEVLLPKYQNK